MMEAMAEDYIRTAAPRVPEAYGCSSAMHFRNALIPIITLLGLSLPTIVGGALHHRNGLQFPGYGAVDDECRASNDDVPLLLGTTLVAALANGGRLPALADILYAVVDPRVRYS